MTQRRLANTNRRQLDGLARRSCAWGDLMGPGYAIGPSSRMLEQAGTAARRGYCR